MPSQSPTFGARPRANTSPAWHSNRRQVLSAHSTVGTAVRGSLDERGADLRKAIAHLLVECVQAAGQCRRVVILAPHERLARDIVLACHLGRLLAKRDGGAPEISMGVAGVTRAGTSHYWFTQHQLTAGGWRARGTFHGRNGPIQRGSIGRRCARRGPGQAP